MSDEILPLIDFSKLKKKKRVKKEENLEENKDKEDLEDFVLRPSKKKGGKVKKNTGEKKETHVDIKEENEKNDANSKFPYEFLLKRLYSLMKDNNQNSSSGGLKIPTIQVAIVGKDRSNWMNFEKFSTVLNRNIEHLFQYVLSELGIQGTIGGENQAYFKAKVTQSSLQKVLTKYINDYVRCPNCKSFKTIIKRDQSTRLQQIYCESCKSEKTIQVIKNRVNATKKKK